MAYITMTNLGDKGRLGNQLFQYAALFVIAKRTGATIAFTSFYNPRHSRDYVLQAFPAVTYKILSDFKLNRVYREPGEDPFDYNEALFTMLKDIPANEALSINGYFQAYQYFHDIRREILRLFRFQDEVREKCHTFLQSLSNKSSKSINISLHVRRGDNVGSGTFIATTVEHITKYMSYFLQLKIKKNKHLTFVIISDDLAWCKSNIILVPDAPYKIAFSPFTNQIDDLCAMAMCKHNIIAASTFSWWGAYLNSNPKKIVLCPKVWFNPDCKFGKLALDNLYLPEWIKIE